MVGHPASRRSAPLGLIGNAVATYGWESARLARRRSPARSTPASRSCCSSSTRCSCGRTGSRRCASSRGAWPAIQLAFVSRSSIGTLPVTERVTERNLGVPRSYASFAVPLGGDDEDGRLRRDLPGALRDLRRAVLRRATCRSPTTCSSRSCPSSARPPPPGVTGAVVMLTLTLSTLGLPLAGVGPAAGDRPDPRHGPHRGERRRPGAGARRSSPSARASSTSSGTRRRPPRTSSRTTWSPTSSRPSGGSRSPSPELVGAGPMSPAVVAGMYPRRPVRASAAVAAPSTTADGSAS